MAEFEQNRYIAFSGIGLAQVDKDTPLSASDIDTRHKCQIAISEVITRIEERDCRDEDLEKTSIDTRALRVQLTYPEVSAEIIALHMAYYLGNSTAPSGSPQNEVQRLTRTGSTGTFTLTVPNFEGRTVTTKPIAYDATAADIESALTDARMKFIQPGDVSVEGGTKQKETLTVTDSASSDGDIVVTVKATNSTALATGKAINVTVANGDTDAQVAAKIKAALDLDADVAAFFTLTVNSADVVFEAKAAAANDTDMVISYPTAQGLTGATSANTTAGVAPSGWSSGGTMDVTFQGRLAKANMPAMTAATVSGDVAISISEITAGAQYSSDLTRKTSKVKERTSFILGWDDKDDRAELYGGAACESVGFTSSRTQQPQFVASYIVPWEPAEILTNYENPECEQINRLKNTDIRIKLNNSWQTANVNSINIDLNDNVPTDADTAYAELDLIDIQDIYRGRQPAYNFTGSFFGDEESDHYELGFAERTQDPVDFQVLIGMPGDRVSILMAKTKVRFQSNRWSFVGTLGKSAVNLEGIPFRNGANAPVAAKVYTNLSEQLLDTPD